MVEERLARPDDHQEPCVSWSDRWPRNASPVLTHLGCFIGEKGQIIAQGRRDGRMFILKTNDVGIVMFFKEQKFDSNIDLWHKQNPGKLETFVVQSSFSMIGSKLQESFFPIVSYGRQLSIFYSSSAHFSFSSKFMLFIFQLFNLSCGRFWLNFIFLQCIFRPFFLTPYSSLDSLCHD